MENILKYFKLIKPYLKLEFIVIVLSFISSIIALINPILLQVVIDKILIQSQIYLLGYIFILFLVFFILSNIVSYSSGYMSTYIGQGILKDLRKKIFRHMQRIKLSEKLELESGDFITKVNDDTAIVSSYVSNVFGVLITHIINILATGALMFIFNETLAVIMFAVTIIEVLISLKFTGIVKENEREIKKVHSKSMNFLNQFFSGFKYMKAYNKEKDSDKKYSDLIEDFIKFSFRGYHISFSYQTLLLMVSFIGSLSIYGIGIYNIYLGHMSVGTLFVFDIIAERFTTFASGIVNFNVEMQTILVSIERLESLSTLEMEEEVKDYTITADNNGNNYIISFENVTFAYKEKQVLKEVTCQFEGGKSYAIIGDSGSGKSSMINLMLKFYDFQEGNIYLNNIPIQRIPTASIRNDLVAVFQDTILNEVTIEENIRYGNYEVSQDEIEYVAKICCIHDFILSLDKGYQSNVGEIGDKISGGQKQRICIARALLRKAKGYVFDEAFSNLDKELEYQIYQNLINKFRDKLIIIISHNLHLMSQFENIIVLNGGIVEAIGSHEELLMKSTTYKKLYSRGDYNHE